MTSKQNIAGVSLGGGRKDNFFFCLMEYYPEENRWFLKNILTVKDEGGMSGDDVLGTWAYEYQLKDLVVDFPLSESECAKCELICPGHRQCPVESVVETKRKIEGLLKSDKALYDQHPKNYERKRLAQEEFDGSKQVFDKATEEPLLSKKFKRRLKKGYLPYWNRPVDVYVWREYYDQMMELFSVSYDSFGSSSLMLQNRFLYLKRHFPSSLNFYEANGTICLLELLRADILSEKQLRQMSDIEEGTLIRLEILKAIETSLNIFIYENDMEMLVRHPKAFRSFLLAVIGQNRLQGKQRELSAWTQPEQTNFIIPNFA